MLTTSVTLLQRVRSRTDDAAWEKFVELYTPFLYRCCRQFGLREDETADALQDVFLLLLDKLPEFEYSRSGSFRGWLRTVTENKCRERYRRREPGAGNDAALTEVADSHGIDALWEQEYRRYLVARALEFMQTEFEPATWRACWQTTVEGRPADEVASELGLTVNAVYLARSRVLRRLRTELGGLLDD